MFDNEALFPLPPGELVGRVSGSAELNQFALSGRRTMQEWAEALQVTGKKFEDFPRIVDFGCGCGRVLRHLRPNLGRHQELLGVDVDAEAIAWVSQAYPGIKAEVLNLLPPSSIDSDSIDLIVNQSVFTHLPEDVQLAWLAELWRILRPGGIAVLSFHGRKVWREFCASLATNEREQEIPVLTSRFLRRGFFYVQGRSLQETALPEYYGSAFHTIAYIEEEWLRYFKLRAWLPVASLGHQDILVLEK
jgi:SAM-dependent methyltransferase